LHQKGESPPKSEAAAQVAKDPLGRGTPRDSLMEFMRAGSRSPSEPWMRATNLLTTILMALLAMPVFAQITATDEKVPCRNYKDVLGLFARLGYTQKAWQAGIREIPRVYLEDVPDTWRARSAKDLSAADKKRLFFRIIAPIVLRINELILDDRARAKKLSERLAQGQSVGPDDQAWLTGLA